VNENLGGAASPFPDADFEEQVLDLAADVPFLLALCDELMRASAPPADPPQE
jgi:hypothetical protein